MSERVPEERPGYTEARSDFVREILARVSTTNPGTPRIPTLRVR